MTFTVPNAAVPGKKIIAQKYNDNNTAIADAINENASDIETINNELPNFLQKDGSVPFSSAVSYIKNTISAVTNATPIVITSIGHGRLTNDVVFVSGVLGNTAANGEWTITRIDANSYSLNNSSGNGAYVSGGTAYFLPSSLENLASIAYVEKSSEIIQLGNKSSNFTISANCLHTANITGSCSLSLPTISTTTRYVECMIEFSLASGVSLTLPTVKWDWDYVPTFSTSAKNLVLFRTTDNGTTWRAGYKQEGV